MFPATAEKCQSTNSHLATYDVYHMIDLNLCVGSSSSAGDVAQSSKSETYRRRKVGLSGGVPGTYLEKVHLSTSPEVQKVPTYNATGSIFKPRQCRQTLT
jgi:hypothetical protein